jgi:hypothetical protein
MSRWNTHVWSLLIAAQGITFLVHPIRAYFKPHQQTVLQDLGTRPWTAWRVAGELFYVACCINIVWVSMEMAPWTESLAISIFLAGLLGYSTYESLQPLSLREDGMRVLTKFLWARTPRFLPWSEIRRYTWVDESTLIVNPGPNQITCFIPIEHVGVVKSMIAEKIAVDGADADQI